MPKLRDMISLDSQICSDRNTVALLLTKT